MFELGIHENPYNELTIPPNKLISIYRCTGVHYNKRSALVKHSHILLI